MKRGRSPEDDPENHRARFKSDLHMTPVHSPRCTFDQLTAHHAASNLIASGVTIVAVKSIQLGQVWRQDQTGQDYLVTKVYNEVFSQFALLRPAEVNAPDAPTVKVKVAKSAVGAGLPGYTFTQEGSF